MKKYFGLLLVLSSVSLKAIPISDDFNDGSLDTSIWSAFTPFSGSSVTESGGALILQSRGGISTVEDLPMNFEMDGSFKFTGALDTFRIGFRSDLSTFSGFLEPTGVFVEFDQERGTLRIAEAGISVVAITPLALLADTAYDFRIMVTGANISVFLDGANAPTLSGQTTYGTGDKAIIYNREIGSAQTSLDFINIARVPDASHSGVMLLLSVLSLGFIKYRSTMQTAIIGSFANRN